MSLKKVFFILLERSNRSAVHANFICPAKSDQIGRGVESQFYAVHSVESSQDRSVTAE